MLPYTLNLLDLLLTLHALRHGGVELNPLMQNELVMIAYKLVGVGAACYWLSKQRDQLAKWGLRICTAVYAGICCYHLYFLLKG